MAPHSPAPAPAPARNDSGADADADADAGADAEARHPQNAGGSNGAYDEIWTVQWCLDGWHDAREAVSRALDPRRFRVRPLDPSLSLEAQVAGAHVLVPTTAAVGRGAILGALPTLRLVAQPASATGNIDLASARAAGVPVTHAPGHNAAATAEVAVMLLLMLLRRAAEAPAAISRGEVGRPVGLEARGRTVGLVGATGRVGSRVARACAALGMRVIGIDRRGRCVVDIQGEGAAAAAAGPAAAAAAAAATEAAAADGAEGAEEAEAGEAEAGEAEDGGGGGGGGGDGGDGAAPLRPSFRRGLRALLERSDVVSLHLPLCAATRGLFGAEELGVMARRGAFLVNTARAGIVDRAALEAALGPADEGAAGGAAGGAEGKGAAGGAEGKGAGEARGGPAAPAPPRLGGAALDVMWQEPCDPRDPLLSHPRALVLPHLGCASKEAYAALGGVLVRNIVAAREGRWGDLEHRVV